MAWLNGIVFWYWLIVAMVLIALEMLVAWGYFLWMGIAAGVVGGLLYFIPSMPWLVQILVFGVISVIALVYYKRYQRKTDRPSDQPMLNRRGEQYIGRVFNLEEPLVNGVGKVKVDDTTWKITGLDYPAGTRIRVVAVQGTILAVEADAG